MKISTAYANANIALVKYWGKSNEALNIPAVPSLSLTLRDFGTALSLRTHEKVHKLIINKNNIMGPAYVRLVDFLEKTRELFNHDYFFEILSESQIPYSAGLASSSAFFAALTKALDNFTHTNFCDQQLSRIARLGSGSAARSMFAHLAALNGGAISDDQAFAYGVALKSNLQLALIICVTSNDVKPISSRQAMINTQNTSPYYNSWVKSAHDDFDHALRALDQDNFVSLGSVMEHSTLKMHASMWTSQPSINYLLPQSLALMNFVYTLRDSYGPIAFFTMDAGPNIKILCEKKNINLIDNLLKQSLLCKHIRICYSGPGAHILNEHLL